MWFEVWILRQHSITCLLCQRLSNCCSTIQINVH